MKEFDKIIADITQLTEKQKVPIRRAIAIYKDRITNAQIEQRRHLFNLLINHILPNEEVSFYKKCKEAANLFQQEAISLEERIRKMFITKAQGEVGNLIEEAEKLIKTYTQEKDNLERKEKLIIKKISKLNRTLNLYEHPAWWRKILLFWYRDGKKVLRNLLMLMEFHGSLTLFRIRNTALSIIIDGIINMRTQLDTISRKLEQKRGVVETVLTTIENEMNVLNDRMKPHKAYQVDLLTWDKASALNDKVKDDTIKSIAMKVVELLENQPGSTVVEFIKKEIDPLFNDLHTIDAGKRLVEINDGDVSKIGTFLKELVENIGAPYCCLNDHLALGTQFKTAVIALPSDENRPLIEKAIEGKIEGNCTVSVQHDPNKVVIFTTEAGIPPFALAGIDDYQQAYEIKHRRKKIVYPERRAIEYRSMRPATPELQLETYLDLGIAFREINYVSRSWWKIDGCKVRSIDKVKARLSVDSALRARIKSRCIEIYNQKGLDGFKDVLTQEEKRIRTIGENGIIHISNRIANHLRSIRQKLDSLNDKQLTSERFLQILFT